MWRIIRSWMDRPVYCSACVHLLLAKRTNVLALCVARCQFKGNSLVKRVNVIGLGEATKRNDDNACIYYRWRGFWSYRSWVFKRWLLERLDAVRARACEFPINESLKEVENGERDSEGTPREEDGFSAFKEETESSEDRGASPSDGDGEDERVSLPGEPDGHESAGVPGGGEAGNSE